MEFECLNKQYSTTRRLLLDRLVSKPNTVDRLSGQYTDGGLAKQGYKKIDSLELPLVSIVTVVYNGDQFLEMAINSVLSQTYDNVEYIIVDGGSTDKTLQIIKQYENCIDYWVSQNDKGMYDALAKGLLLTNGSVIGWLNSDDKLMPWALALVSSFIKSNTTKWITGIPAYWDNKGLLTAVGTMPYFPKTLIKNGWFNSKALGCIQQESTFFKRELYDSLSASDVCQFKETKLAGDFLLWKRFAENNRLVVLPTVLAGFRKHKNQLSNDLKAYNKEVADIGAVCFPMGLSLIVKALYRIATILVGGIRQNSTIKNL